MQPHRRQPTRLPRPWDSPGKNTGVGCYFLLQCMKVKSESEVAQSFPTLSDSMDWSLPGSSIRGIFQARVLAHQAPLSLGFSRQEYWSGLPFPSPTHERKSEGKVAHSCLTLNDPMDCSLPGSSVHGIFQARVLEWGAIAFSDIEA